jgi:hypothetical protein
MAPAVIAPPGPRKAGHAGVAVDTDLCSVMGCTHAVASPLALVYRHVPHVCVLRFQDNQDAMAGCRRDTLPGQALPACRACLYWRPLGNCTDIIMVDQCTRCCVCLCTCVTGVVGVVCIDIVVCV